MSELHLATIIDDADLADDVEFAVRLAATPGLLRGTFVKLKTYLLTALIGHLVPSGGTTGQVLKKASATDYDIGWGADNVGSGGPTTLDGLTDVDTSTVAPVDGDLLRFDNASGLWKPHALPLATTAQVQAGASTTTAVSPAALIAAAVPQVLVDAATVAWDMSIGFNARVTLGGNRTIGTPTNPHEGLTYALGILQDATGSRTLTWPACVDWGSAGAPTLSTGAGKRDIVFLYCYDAVSPSFRATFNKSA